MDITEDSIKKMVQDGIDNYTQQASYGVTLIPYHLHTGVDSPQISYKSLTDKPTAGNVSVGFAATTRDWSAGSGTQTVAHGLTVIPDIVEVSVIDGVHTIYGQGGATATAQSGIGSYNAGAYATSSTYALYFYNVGTLSANTGLVSFDATNITIIWTITFGTQTIPLLFKSTEF